MIKNASDLLAAFIAKERKVVDAIPMQHMPTLGSAYEAIAREGINQEFILPPGLDLHVVSGFIKGLPKQIDCMLVQGKGQRYGLTDQYIYPVRQVLCVLEIKKTLDSAALDMGIKHLKNILLHCDTELRSRLDSDEAFDLRSAQSTFQKLTGRIGPLSKWEGLNLPEPDRISFVTFLRQAYAPVTVLLGFDGYSTEHGLRSAMLNFVKSNIDRTTRNVPEILPALIIAGAFSLVKCTGQPYLCRAPNGGWVLLASSRGNVARILLEFIWTKIEVICGIPMPFGSDVDHEYLRELIVARGKSIDGKGVFDFSTHEFSEKDLVRPELTNWEPRRLSAAAIEVAKHLISQTASLKLDLVLSNFIHEKHGVVLNDAVTELVNTHTFCRSETELRPIGSYPIVVECEDGTGYVDLRFDRLNAWSKKQGFGLCPVMAGNKPQCGAVYQLMSCDSGPPVPNDHGQALI
ncbi:MAG: DUF6602 domain-containing protein [Achromobacter pulmonis]